MRPETQTLVTYQFGHGVRKSETRNVEDRYRAGLENLSCVVRANVERLLSDERLDVIEQDILAALLAEVPVHFWNMTAIRLFNEREG